jgi:hypothetical protein
MDFDLSEEQRLLKESVDGLLTDSYDFEQRRKYMKEKGGWSRAVWGRLAEQAFPLRRKTAASAAAASRPRS